MSGSASLDLERLMLGHTLAIAPMPTLARVYVALCQTAPTEAAGGSELAGGGYARTAATFALMATPANAAANATAVDFAPATADWRPISHFELWTAATGGTRLYWGQLLDPADGAPIEIDVLSGSAVRFSPGSLVVQAAEITATGGGTTWLPASGGEMTGPLDLTATGGTTAWSEQDRWGSHLDARDFGIICDGITDQGAQLNAALASMGRGTALYIPGSVYTTQTIKTADGQRLVGPPLSVLRPSVGSPLMMTSCAIIGANSLSPVVLVTGGEGGLTDIAITRNGTPPAGSIGLQCFGQDHIYTRVYSYNHARCIQIGAPRSAPVDGAVSAITTRFDHCMTWNSTEDSVYLLNAPETTFYDHRFGINGETSPNLGNSLVCINGDNNDATAGATNTVSFIRCQFNVAATVPHLYTIRCISWNYGGINLFSCYSGGATNAFLYIDPSCTKVADVKFIGNEISPMSATETLISDPGHKLVGLKLLGNWIDGGTSPGLFLSGISAQVIGNSFGGPFTLQLDAMTSGVCIGNSVNTLSLTGVFTGYGFICSNNNAVTFVQTATGEISYSEPRGNYGTQLRLGKTGQAGRADFMRAADGAPAAWVGFSAAGGTDFGVAVTPGSPVIFLDARNTGGTVSLRTNSVERFSVTDTIATVSVPLAINASGPTIRSGTGAATGTQPKGSLWLRTDGAVGSTLYVSQGAGTWNAVAGA